MAGRERQEVVGSSVYWRGGNMLAPVPVVLVSCGNQELGTNIITIAWAGTVCSDPAMVSISVRKSRYSHRLIKETGEFVVNMTSVDLLRATDWCGVKSGKDVDKWEAMGLTAIASKTVGAPSIGESPVSLECKVRQVIELGSHDMFIGEVTQVRADQRYINENSGALDMGKIGMICYAHGEYYAVGKKIGRFGWSVRKKKSRK